MTTINKYSELNATWSTKVHQGVHRRSYRPSGEEYVIDQDDTHILNCEEDIRPSNFGAGSFYASIVTVQRNIDFAMRQFHTFVFFNPGHKTLCEVDPARVNVLQPAGRSIMG